MKNPAPAGFFVFGTVRVVAGWRLRLIRPTGWLPHARIWHDVGVGIDFVGPISEAPSGNGMLHDSTLGADFVGLISEAPSGNAAVAELVNIKEG